MSRLPEKVPRRRYTTTTRIPTIPSDYPDIPENEEHEGENVHEEIPSEDVNPHEDDGDKNNVVHIDIHHDTTTLSPITDTLPVDYTTSDSPYNESNVVSGNDTENYTTGGPNAIVPPRKRLATTLLPVTGSLEPVHNYTESGNETVTTLAPSGAESFAPQNETGEVNETAMTFAPSDDAGSATVFVPQNETGFGNETTLAPSGSNMTEITPRNRTAHRRRRRTTTMPPGVITLEPNSTGSVTETGTTLVPYGTNGSAAGNVTGSGNETVTTLVPSGTNGSAAGNVTGSGNETATTLVLSGTNGSSAENVTGTGNETVTTLVTSGTNGSAAGNVTGSANETVTTLVPSGADSSTQQNGTGSGNQTTLAPTSGSTTEPNARNGTGGGGGAVVIPDFPGNGTDGGSTTNSTGETTSDDLSDIMTVTEEVVDGWGDNYEQRRNLTVITELPLHGGDILENFTDAALEAIGFPFNISAGEGNSTDVLLKAEDASATIAAKKEKCRKAGGGSCIKCRNVGPNCHYVHKGRICFYSVVKHVNNEYECNPKYFAKMSFDQTIIALVVIIIVSAVWIVAVIMHSARTRDQDPHSPQIPAACDTAPYHTPPNSSCEGINPVNIPYTPQSGSATPSDRDAELNQNTFALKTSKPGSSRTSEKTETSGSSR